MSKGFKIGDWLKRLTPKLISPLPCNAPQAVGEETRSSRRGCLASTNGVCGTSTPVQTPEGNAAAITHLTKKWMLQQSKSTGTVRAPIARWYYKAMSIQITIQLVISHSRKPLIWLGKNPCFVVVETKVKSYPSPPRRACARPRTWLLGHPTPLPAFIFSAQCSL